LSAQCLSAHVLSTRRLDDLTRRVIQPGAGHAYKMTCIGEIKRRLVKSKK
jgi:hypothetical protein